MKWGARFTKVKHRLGEAYSTSLKWLSVADRAHVLLSKGYGAVQDRLEPEVQEKVGGAFGHIHKKAQTGSSPRHKFEEGRQCFEGNISRIFKLNTLIHR